MLNSAREVEVKIKARVPGRWRAGSNLYLLISKLGNRSASWVIRYQIDGRGREMGLGPVELVSLAEARDKAYAARKLLLAGIDPIQDRDARRSKVKLDAARSITFASAAAQYVAAHGKAWSNSKHRVQWSTTLETYVFPIFGEIAVADIDTGLVLKVLEPIWSTRYDTARRIRSRIEAVLDWAKVRGYRQGENPARWKGHLDKLLAARGRAQTVKHHPAMAVAELPGFMAELRKRQTIPARALEFTILTAGRTAEVLGARWEEIDLPSRTWTIPASRMKTGRVHRVPLSPPAAALLEAMPRIKGNDHLFPGRGRKPLGSSAMLQTMRVMAAGFTAHGFRSTFRDWAAEQTNYPNHVVEQALAHAIGSRVEAAYRRGDLFAKRVGLMSDWAQFVG